MIHNAYQQWGGEDAVVDQEAKMLVNRGHAVQLFIRHNNEINAQNPLLSALETIWSARSAQRLAQEIAAFRPDVVHAHNTFPLISPAVYWTAARQGIPVIQTLHNFRLLCAQAMFLRSGKICEDCLGRLPWRGAARRCYRGAYSQSAGLVAMLFFHRFIGSYRNKVSCYIALNAFCRRKFIEGGLPAGRIAVKPNFVDIAPAPPWQRKGFLFVGRLSPEKGLSTLAQAAGKNADAQLTIIGEGPCRRDLQKVPNAKLKGFRETGTVHEAMQHAACLVLPSICYENFPRTLVEAFACGLPVIASRCGALSELVKEGQTGLLFQPGDSEDLAQKMRWAQDNPEAMQAMGNTARAEYEARYTSAINYRQLMAVYAEAMNETTPHTA